MADMPTDFWGGWIVVITVVSLLGLIWLIFSIYFSANKHEEFKSPVWDESLSEGSYPAPMWWFWMILIALVISVVYLMLYPGLGSFSGVLKWSQAGRLDHSLTYYNEKFAPLRKKVMQLSISELQNDSDIMASARRIFTQNCAACHGPNGEGQASAFPNLKDDDWQWGNSEAAIEQTLRQGRRGVMVSWQNVLGDEGIAQVINYIKTLSSDTAAVSNDPGQKLYKQFCVACHGAVGEGNTAVGAPNLTDDIWLYGNSDAALHHSVAVGRNGVMPAFDNRLDDAQIRMLIAWLMRSDGKTVTASRLD